MHKGRAGATVAGLGSDPWAGGAARSAPRGDGGDTAQWIPAAGTVAPSCSLRPLAAHQWCRPCFGPAPGAPVLPAPAGGCRCCGDCPVFLAGTTGVWCHHAALRRRDRLGPTLGCSPAPRGPPPAGVLPCSPWAWAPLATPLAPQRRPLAPGAVQAASVQEQPLLKQNNLQKYRYSLCPTPGHGSCPGRGLSPPQSCSPPGPRAPGRWARAVPTPGRSRPLAAGAGSPQPRPGPGPWGSRGRPPAPGLGGCVAEERGRAAPRGAKRGQRPRRAPPACAEVPWDPPIPHPGTHCSCVPQEM